jgi:hypothetical protein
MQQAIGARQAQDATVKHIAEQLGERDPQPLKQLHRIVAFLGPEQAVGFLQETMEIEAHGGLMLPDGSRRRTPGGIFFHLIRTKGPAGVRRCFLPYRPKPATPTQPTAQESAVAPFTWQQRITALDEIGIQKGHITTVKITIIGRPGKIISRGSCIVTSMRAKQAPSLPKGLPTPPAYQTTYTLYIAMKQWNKVAEAIRDPEDTLIVEGFPQLDPETSCIAVFATNTTTKKLQQAQRQAQQAESSR